MSDELVVSVSEGKLRGKICKDYNGKEYYSFQGIPYAKPPVGKLRFKPPQPPEKWKGIRDATKEGAECYSRNLLTNVMGGSEDCLFLNVFTRKIKTKERLPVMFWIHGGGFIKGSGGTDLFGPDYLIEKNVVLVTMNYRIGVLGFLALSDPTTGATGNAGLKDQVMALKWVQRNIERFCGDRKNVTIFGESAGGASVHFLLLSPITKGLFHKAILQSGCALNCFARGKCAGTHQFALKLGIDSNNDHFILSELQKIPVDELVRAGSTDTCFISEVRPFSPVIEPNTSDALITEEPLQIIKSGRYNKVPIIMGYNTTEGVFVYMLMKYHGDQLLTDKSLVPHTMNLRIGGEQYKTVVEKIRRMYGLSGKESSKNQNDVDKALKIYTHNFFMFDVCKSALLHSILNKFPIYFYRLNLDTELNVIKKLSGVTFEGAAHADDLPYLFTNGLNLPPEKNSLEYNLIQKITTLWTNFAKYGNPTPSVTEELKFQWKPVSINQFNYLALENDNFESRVNPDKEIVEFWDLLFREHQVHLSKL